MILSNVKNIKTRGQNVLSVKYNGQVIWRKKAESSPLTIIAEIYLTNASFRLFGVDSSYNTLDRVEHVYIDDVEVPIQGTYSRSIIGATTAGKHNLKVVLKKQDVYDLSYLFYNHNYNLFTGSTTTYKGIEILPNTNGEKYEVSDFTNCFRESTSTTVTSSFEEIKGLNNINCTGSLQGIVRYCRTRKLDVSEWVLNETHSYIFSDLQYLETINLGILGASTATSGFINDISLVNITIKGITASTSFKYSPLSKQSVLNIVNAMSGTKSCTLTISETSRGYFTDEEWNELLSKVPSNWSVLVDTSVASASLLNDFGMPNDYKYISDEI